MLLAIDIGNTNIKLGIFKGDTLLASWRISTAIGRTSDEYGNYIVGLLKSEGYSADDISGAITSSVIPSLNYTIEHMLKHFFPSAKSVLVRFDMNLNIKLDYINPAELGADRITSSVAARALYGVPCIVIDFGTATTFNVINGEGVFLGGCICAGVKLCMDALSTTTSKLPNVEIVRPDSVVGKSTITNMQSGAVFGLVGQVDYIIKKIKQTAGMKDAQVIATGGLSEILADENIIDITDRTLTLRGLEILYGLN